ncbi:MAG: DUF429 domain-containing protein [Syntrophobacteraceae bacterium]
MPLICGVDGCKAGWIAVFKGLDAGDVFWNVFPTFEQLAFRTPTPQVIAVDIPIGLPNEGPRACDLEARSKLGRRASSVFPAPIRPVLAATSYNEACQIRFHAEKKKMSRQAWGIVSKVREVDELLRQNPELRSRIREVHPEVCFYYMNGGIALPDSKRTEAGQIARRILLQPQFGEWLNIAVTAQRPYGCAPDDILDGFAALWTAERIAESRASSIPAIAAVDSCGLRMEIVA